MNEENIVFLGAAIESNLIGSTRSPIFRHSLYQQEQQVQRY
ncbi:hypothetical protein [Bacillus cereus]